MQPSEPVLKNLRKGSIRRVTNSFQRSFFPGTQQSPGRKQLVFEQNGWKEWVDSESIPVLCPMLSRGMPWELRLLKLTCQAGRRFAVNPRKLCAEYIVTSVNPSKVCAGYIEVPSSKSPSQRLNKHQVIWRALNMVTFRVPAVPCVKYAGGPN